MAVFDCAVLTKKGNELLIDAVAGNEITFTRMIVGSGAYTDEERKRSALEKMENMKDAKQEFTFSACKKESAQCYKLTAVISNRELTESYKITEIGIYGKKNGDTKDFLCSISVTKSLEESDTFPPFNGLQECQIVQDYYITISPDAEVNVITKGASVLIEDFLAKIEEIRKEFSNKIEEIRRSFQAGVDKIYNYLKGLGFTPAEKSPEEICVSIQEIFDTRYQNGYNAGYSEGRLQGQEDVKENPSEFGISVGVEPEQIKMYSSREDFNYGESILAVPHDGTCNLKFSMFASYRQSHGANNLILSILRNNSAVAYEIYEKDVANGGEFLWDETIEIQNCTEGENLTFHIDHIGADVSWVAGLY